MTPRLLVRLMVNDPVIADTSPHGPYAASLDKSQVPPMSGLHMIPLMGLARIAMVLCLRRTLPTLFPVES
jgi:hypothetical protein